MMMMMIPSRKLLVNSSPQTTTTRTKCLQASHGTSVSCRRYDLPFWFVAVLTRHCLKYVGPFQLVFYSLFLAQDLYFLGVLT